MYLKKWSLQESTAYVYMYMILIISLIASLHVLHGFNLRVGPNGEFLEKRRWQAKDLPMDCLHPAGLHRRGYQVGEIQVWLRNFGP